MGPKPRVVALVAVALLSAAGLAFARGGPPKGAAPGDDDKKKAVDDAVELAASWIYDDVDRGFAEAMAGNKPLCIVFR
jgi:hypothetical protein